MSYVPPHKRVSKAQGAPPPMPAKMITQFKKSLSIEDSSRRGPDSKTETSKSISTALNYVYANNSVVRWLAVPSMDDFLLPSLCLVPVCTESIGQKTGAEQFILVNARLQQGHHEIKSNDLKHIWTPVVETLHADLMSAFEDLRDGLVDQNLEETKPKIIARFGKLLFRRNNPSINLDCAQENPVSEPYIKDLRRNFYSNVPVDYIEHIKRVVVPELGVQSEEDQEQYHVKLADAERPGLIISCKCRVVKNEKMIELDKIELLSLRHLMEDISCLECNVDLRLALCAKKDLMVPQDEEMQRIRDLITLAIFDPNVKGGLKWPVGKTNSRGQYSVVGVSHIKTEAYSSSRLRLRIREIDRYDFLGTVGDLSREVSLALTEITENLLDQRCEAGNLMAMLEDALKLIQNHFLAWDGRLVSCR